MLGGITVKEFRNFRGHVLTIISIVLILNLLFNLSNETFEKNRIDYDAKPLLTMDELINEETKIEYSTIDGLYINKEKVGYIYNLYITNTDSNSFKKIELKFTKINDEKLLVEQFNDEIREEVTYINKQKNMCTGSKCHMPTLRYEKALEQLFELDIDNQKVVRAYSLYPIDNNELKEAFTNIIFILRRNDFVIIKVSSKIEISTKINDILDKVDLYDNEVLSKK